jgi:hypothetical protein
VRLSTLSDRAEVYEKWAEDTERRVEKLQKKLVDSAAAHETEIQRITGEYENLLSAAQRDWRAKFVDLQEKQVDHVQKLIREHARRMAAVMSGQPHEPTVDPAAEAASELEPAPNPVAEHLARFATWQDAARGLDLVDDADPWNVRVYNMLTPLQQFTLRGLTLDVMPPTIANSERVSIYLIDREVLTACRRFRKRDEPELGVRDLKAIGRDLFGLKKRKQQLATISTAKRCTCSEPQEEEKRRGISARDAREWRREYDADDTLRVADLAERHYVSPYRMRRALLSAGGALRRSGVTRAARKRAGLTADIDGDPRAHAPKGHQRDVVTSADTEPSPPGAT